MKMHAMKLVMVALACIATLYRLQSFAADGEKSVVREYAAASEAEREHWRKAIAATPPPPGGCFRANFPDTKWQEVKCDYSPRKLRMPLGGVGVRLETVGGSSGDMSAQVPGGITQALGSFDSVATTGATDSLAGSGKYSLQINTEFFNTTVCSGAGSGSNCHGWEQFVFDYDGRTSMQYWLTDYGPPGFTCPSPHGASCDGTFVYTDGWCEFALYGRTYCAVNSPVVNAGAVSPTALSDVRLQANAAVAGGTDSFTATVRGAAHRANGGNFFSDLASKWHEAEFNVFGYGNSSRVNFDPNTTLVVRVSVDSGVNAPPGCDFHSFTAETNDLSVINTTSTPLHSGHPSLIFTESNSGTPNPTCSAGVSIGDTHLTTFGGLHYDFQASGDFLLAEVANEFTVQVRQAPVPQWPNAAVNKGVAVRMGKTRIELYVDPSSIEINGKPHGFEDGQTLMIEDEVQMRRQGNTYTISDKHGNRVRATLNSNWIDTAVLVGHSPSHVHGLLGNPAEDGKSLSTSAGARLGMPVTFNDLYGVFASSWYVPRKESLFSKDDKDFRIPSRTFYAQDLPTEVAARARAECERAGVKDSDLLEDCVLDTAVLNDKVAPRAFVQMPVHVRTVLKPVFIAPVPCNKVCAKDKD